MAKATVKKASVGSSFKLKDGTPQPANLGALHKGGKTAPTFNAARMDKMEKSGKKK